MSLVDNYVMPFYFFETVKTYSHSFVTGDDYIKFSFLHNLAQDFLSLVSSGNQLDHICARHPLLKLIHPVSQSNFGSHNDMRPTYLLVFLDEGKDGDSLDGLSKAHIVSEYSADPTLVKTDHPVQANQLIVFQESPL